MGTINKVTQGSLAKNKKLNEVIDAINSITNMSVREGNGGESPKFIFGELKSELITTKEASPGQVDPVDPVDPIESSYLPTDIILCENGLPVNGEILFKIST